jgi:hypothetical protein
MRLLGFIALLVLLSLIMAQTVSAQNSPVVPAPMVPFAQWPPAVPTTSPGISVANQAGISNANQFGATTPPGPEVNTSLSQAQVVGTGNFVGLSSAYGLTSDQPSLAEAAREARQRLAKEHPRVFTNDDIARLRQKAGEPAIGIAAAGPPVTSQQTMPASDVTTANPAAPNAANPNAHEGTQGNGVQSKTPASDQTAPQGSSTQPPPVKSSPFRPKQ